MDKISLDLLKQIANLDAQPQGAFNIRLNGESVSRSSTENVEIRNKKNKPGIDIIVKKGVKSESIHIPVILTKAGINECVYNDFYIGDNADVTIIAGCGIYNCSNKLSEHDGIHTFHIGKNAKVRYVEKHLGIGKENSEKVLNPTTRVFIKEGGSMKMETTQIGGVSYSNRKTFARLFKDAKLVIEEKILTTENQIAKTKFLVNLVGEKSSVDVISRSVAKDTSLQEFKSTIVGKNECFGHVECDGIIVGNGKITSIPEIKAENVNSTLIHEAAIGKIAGDELIKLETLGLSEKEAEEQIISGFLK